MDFEKLRDQLRRGECVSDTQFDKIFPPELRGVSERHWSSVEVALEASRFLTARENADLPRRILDVGSGAGKFCLVGALSTDAYFVGAERRRELAEGSRKLARELKVERVRFLWQDFLKSDWNEFTGVYLFNPFQENVDDTAQIDESVPCSRQHYEAYVRKVETGLAQAPAGFRAAAYYGFGGSFPPAYRVTRSELVPELEFALKET